jgi:hypothetical protein
MISLFVGTPVVYETIHPVMADRASCCCFTHLVFP